MKAIVNLTVVVASLVAAGNVFAQSSSFGAPPPATSPPFAYRHASTLEEGVARGMADFARGVGEYNYNTSAAMINIEEARSRYLDNLVKGTEVFFERRRINQQARALERGERPTQVDLDRYNQKRREVAHRLSTPDAPTIVNGKIMWPETLLHPMFDSGRAELERLVQSGGFGSAPPSPQAVQAAVAWMQGTLYSNIDFVHPSAYIHAKKFLSGLGHEALHGPLLGAVAQR